MPPTQCMTSPQTFPQSSEALEAVLGRFQEWTSSRKTSMDQGVRQLSYEEAVESTRQRFQAARTQNTGRLKAEPGVIPVDTPSPAVSREAKDNASRRSRKGAAVAAKAPSLATEKDASSRARKPKPATEFRKVLAETIAPPPQPQSKTTALTHAGQAKADRQVSMSLRLAPAEQAMIRARASEAGISTSAYLRQCALEVEQLREQMRHALALIGQGAAMAVSNSQVTMQAPQPGFLERLKRVFLGEKQVRNLELRA